MRRVISAVLSIACLLSFVGCGQKINNTPTDLETVTDAQLTTTDETTLASEPVIVDRIPAQVSMAAVSLPVNISNIYTEDDVLLFTQTTQTLSLIIPDTEIENKVILDFQTRLDNFSSTTQAMIDQARSDYSASSDWTPYFSNIVYSPGRIDLSVLSLFGSNTSWTGGAHPSHNCTSANYDLITGDVLTLGSILTSQESLEPLCNLLIEEVAEIKAEKFVMSDYEQIIRNRFAQNESYNEAWYFSNDGLNFYFSPYEIAPYSSGIITLTIPYEKLTGIIEDQFFPAEKEIAYGNILATKYADADLDMFTQIAEVILEQDGEMIFLYTDRSVNNVALEIGDWNDDNQDFSSKYTVFSTPILTPGDAVMVQLTIPKNNPNLRLSYDSGNETVYEFLQISDQNNTVMLLDESAL